MRRKMRGDGPFLFTQVTNGVGVRAGRDAPAGKLETRDWWQTQGGVSL